MEEKRERQENTCFEILHKGRYRLRIVITEDGDVILKFKIYHNTKVLDNHFYMLGTNPWNGIHIDCCGIRVKSRKLSGVSFAIITDLISDNTKHQLACHLMNLKTRQISDGESTIPIELDEIRRLLVPQNINRELDLVCQICFDQQQRIILATGRNACHTFCDDCAKKFSTCPFSNMPILYKVRYTGAPIENPDNWINKIEL